MARISMRESFQRRPADCIGRPRRIGNNTFEYKARDGSRVVRLHLTDIVRHCPDGRVTLNSGGWQTVTTKGRMNGQLDGWRVYSDRGVWYVSPVSNWDRRVAFADGMTIHPDGKVEGEGPDPRETARLRRRINRYVDQYITALAAGKVPAPSAGDCWGCAMTTADGRNPLGGRGHIVSHVEEGYFVPSLLARAIEAFPVAPIVRHELGCIWRGRPDLSYGASLRSAVLSRQIKSALRRFCYREVGLPA